MQHRLLVSTAALATLVTLAFGSAGGSSSGDYTYEPEAVDITAPWAEMALPLADGVVEDSDADSLTVAYPIETDQAALTETWLGALDSQGWKVQDDDGDRTGIISLTLIKGEEDLDMTVMTIEGVSVDVDLSL